MFPPMQSIGALQPAQDIVMMTWSSLPGMLRALEGIWTLHIFKHVQHEVPDVLGCVDIPTPRQNMQAQDQHHTITKISGNISFVSSVRPFSSDDCKY